VIADQRRRSVRAVLVILSIGAAVLAHFTIVDRLPPALGAALSLVPVALLVAWAARRSERRGSIVLALLAGVAALSVGWGALERNFASLFFVEHASVNAGLALMFGRTLAEGREALCTRLARLLHGSLPPEVVAYTRTITLAWTVFFALLTIASAALYLGGFREAWSVLATMLSPVLLGLMFVGEYLVRLRALPHWERTGILGTIRAASRHFAAARLETPR
jgi:uncharacterized membrane protein